VVVELELGWFSGVFCGEIQWIALARCPVTSPLFLTLLSRTSRVHLLFLYSYFSKQSAQQLFLPEIFSPRLAVRSALLG
jgi:hypothetical protein